MLDDFKVEIDAGVVAPEMEYYSDVQRPKRRERGAVQWTENRRGCFLVVFWFMVTNFLI